MIFGFKCQMENSSINIHEFRRRFRLVDFIRKKFKNLVSDIQAEVSQRNITANVFLSNTNGLNSNFLAQARTRLTNATANGAFSLGGFLPLSGIANTHYDGQTLRIYNTSAQAMTIIHEDSSSTDINRIRTLTGANVAIRAGANSFANFSYDAIDQRWILENTMDLIRQTLAANSALANTNGLNSNFAAQIRTRITNANGAFSLGGFAALNALANGHYDGETVRVYNASSQTMTIVNEDASSTANNRIKTLTGANVVLRSSSNSYATFTYDMVDGRWIVESTN